MPKLPRAAILAGAALVVWNGAFLAGRQVGIWGPMAGAALALDALALWAEPGLRRVARPTLRALGVGLAATVVQVGATYLLYPLATRLVPGLWDQVNDLYRLMGHPNAWQAWLALPLVVLSEELIFRGAIQEGLAKRVGPWLGAVAAVGVYLPAHALSGSWALAALTLPCGLYWGFLRVAGKGLWAPFLCHLLWDWAILVVVPLGA